MRTFSFVSHSSASAKSWEPPSIEEFSAQLPQYQIEALLGSGGMGAVYKGRQTSLDRPVAIKILSGALEDSDVGFAERFKNEARAMGKLNHPGIVGVYDFGQTSTGLLYIVMEYVDGTDVAKMIAMRRRLHTEHAMAITAHVCDALAYAHERGIIHRDIKPANIMVGYDGAVKVADFGLAKMSQTAQSGITQSNVVMGTLHYMAPEALTLGTAVDQRADIYAVGVMLYQMLTGKLPQGMFEMPSLQAPGLDPRYDKIVATAMRDDRELRYASARALRLELDAIVTQPVVKVEASAKEAPPALNTQARPKRPEWQPAKLPHAPQMKRSSPYASILLATLFVTAGWIYWQQSGYHLVFEPTPREEQQKDQNSPAILAVSKESLFVNTLGMKFVPVPGTKVLFCIHETRRQDYAAYAAEVPGLDGSWKSQTRNGIPCGSEDNHPVVGVSWEHSMKFCEWLSKKEGKSYRLPSDEEWSTAVGLSGKEKRLEGGTPQTLHGKETTGYPWGGDYPPKTHDRAGNYADSTWLEKFPNDPGMKDYTDGFATTAPVMSFKPNKLGIYDMGGNVWEWVEDWWNEAKTNRVLRGGSYAYDALEHLRSSGRFASMPKSLGRNIGFRVVLADDAAQPSSVPAPAGPAQVAASGNSAIQGSPGTTAAIPPSLPPPATKDQPFVNTLGMKFVPVPISGGPTKGKWLLFSIWHTRVQDYATYVKAQESMARKVDGSWKSQEKDGTPAGREPDHPVVGVSWEDAQAFCKWLTQKETAEGKLASGSFYRLPSDEEWSWAAEMPLEAGTIPREKHRLNGAVFAWGKEWPPKQRQGNFADESFHGRFPKPDPKRREVTNAWIAGYQDGYATTSPVGIFTPNRLGLYDMAGNAWQWCEDWWDSTQKERVLRGGSWRNKDNLNSNFRHFMAPPSRYNYLGFRCVLVVSAPAASAAKAAPAANAKTTETVPLPQGPTTWTDVKGRGLVATFKSIQGDAVLLEIGGKTLPVALAALSEGSRNLARAYQSRAGPMAAFKDTPFINTLGMKFVPVPPTKVLFCIHEARWQDYAAYAAETPGINGGWKNQSHDGRALAERIEEHPVTQVSWEDAQAFCAWLSKKEGKTYRLPTDREWSYAVGIGQDEKWDKGTTPATVNKSQTYFPWGDQWPPPKGSGNYSDDSRKAKAPNAAAQYLENYDDGFPTTAPVMSYKPNNLGLYDMGGNVWEWCEDWFDAAQKDRVLRGGCWSNYARNILLSSLRGHDPPGPRNNYSGFRIVLADNADQPSAAPSAVGPAQSAASGNSARAKSSGGATTNSQGQVTRAVTSGAEPSPAPLLSTTGISSAVDAIKQSGTDKKTCLKRFLALSEQTKGVYSFKLQNEIRHYAVDLDRTAELAACNEIFANERMHPYIISILDGTHAPGQKNAPAKHATQAKQVALEARAFPFVRAACWLRAGELLSGLGRFDEAAASYKHVLEMPDEKLSAYKELARIRLEKLPK
jgi:formylglycine-generating enzyme required for sulfatase activity/serine/threonine protein kinase